MSFYASEHLGAAAGAGEGPWGLCRAWVLPRTAGGSGAPEPCLRWALRACSARAELGGEVVHGEAVGAKLVRGDEVLANLPPRSRSAAAGQHLDEARTGRRLQPAQGLDFARRDVVVGDQDEMQVIGHDHEIAQCCGRPNLVHGHESGLHDFAKRRESRARLLIDKLGKHFGTAFDRQRDEEEAIAGVGEGEVHGGESFYLLCSGRTLAVYTNPACESKWAA